MSSEHKPADPAEALEALRERLGWHTEMPSIEHVHIPGVMALDVENRTIALCVHDEANDCNFMVWWPAPNGPIDILNEDGTVREGIVQSCARHLCATYN